ncbi:Condensin-2 complex subunit H2 [Platanthera zijinensis]|uniref:Condensin-2 complex subunit H2 n=1 Tax=Platanthera zijinensis TaxID=2320716 RepID=A0AAP0FVQ2_9ASPA
MSDREDPPEDEGGSSGSAARLDFLQPRRDLQSNWEVDLAKNLEEYLLKICSGEIPSEQSINFAEAALLLQGSVQVYSRKVEYLYSLVLRVLEFLSQKRQDQHEKDRSKPGDNETSTAIQEEDDAYLGLDDVPVEAKNYRNDALEKCEISNLFAKAPTNLLVFEGDCLDSSGEANELESYLLATCDFYGDFLLLDPCDAGGIDSFLQNSSSHKEQVSTHKGVTPNRPKIHENDFQSPVRSSGVSFKTSLKKGQNVNITESAVDYHVFDADSVLSEPDTTQNYGEEPHSGYADTQDDSDEDEDPWKPLNPHEPGNLKIKPFRKGRNLRKQVNPISRRKNQSSQFPLAKMDGIISSDLAESFEVKVRLNETQSVSQSPALYEKLRGSLSFGNVGSFDFFEGIGSEDQNGGAEDDLPDFDQPDYEMDMEAPSFGEKERDASRKTDGAGPSCPGDLECSQNLEDLCRSHLDGLLAMIAESEKQTELAARVSTWKQRIEEAMDEQEKLPAFDIHIYGERILDKLSLGADDGGGMTFTDVVVGQPKYEVSRTFSALLQLVNNGNVDLQRPQSSSELVCHTAKNPFRVRLLHCVKQKVQVNIPSAKKRQPSPLRKGSEAASPLKAISHVNDKVSTKLKKGALIRHTPERKRRRRSASSFGKHLHSATDV